MPALAIVWDALVVFVPLSWIACRAKTEIKSDSRCVSVVEVRRLLTQFVRDILIGPELGVSC